MMQTTNLIPENLDKVGVMVSGGIDSALMLYLVAEESKTKQRPVEVVAYTVHRHDGSEQFSNQVVHTVSKMTGVKIEKVVVGNPNISSTKVVQLAIFDATLYHCKFVLLATTGVPDNLKWLSDHPIRYPENTKAMYQPWVHHNKDEVVKYVIENNLLELAKVSHSCTVKTFGRCRECYWCHEREWAFNVNGIEDPGID